LIVKKWKTILEQDVRYVWACDDEDCEQQGEEITVDGDWHQTNGTPSCECGRDMEYLRTEVAHFKGSEFLEPNHRLVFVRVKQ
jgi:hypothetical protein